MSWRPGPTPGWGTVTLGRVALRETFSVAEDQGRVLQITGQTSVSGLTYDQVERIYEDLYGLSNELIPITWSDKAFLNGYYRVRAVKTDHASYPTLLAASAYDKAVVLDWSLEASRIGPANAVDLESKLSGPQTRLNTFGGLGEITHAPPPAHYGYTTGGTVPSSMVRATEDGPITVYRQIPPNTHPRWGCTPQDFGGGRCRFIDSFGEERAGVTRATSPAGWVLSNGIIKVSPGSSGTLTVSSWLGGAWLSREWDLLRDGVSVAPFTAATVLANTFDTVILRLITGGAAGNPKRSVTDLQLRRGARLLEVFLQSDSSATLVARLHTAEPGVAGGGSIGSLGEAEDGTRYVLVSADAVTKDLTVGGMSVSSARILSVALGALPANGAVNPNTGFETNTTGWTGVNGTLTQSGEQAKYGVFSGKLVSDGTSVSMSVNSGDIAVLPATKYTIAAWVRCPHGRSVTVTVTWKTPGGATISTVVTPMNLPPDVWIPALAEISAPATATKAQITIAAKQTVPWSSLTGYTWSSLLTWEHPITFVETLYLDGITLRPVPSGDSVADMASQHLGTCAEVVTAVKR